MELTKELVDEVVLAVNDVEYGRVIIFIFGPPGGKIVDIVPHEGAWIETGRTVPPFP